MYTGGGADYAYTDDRKQVTIKHLMLQVTSHRSATCAGAKPSAPHQATLTASLTDGWNHPVVGKNIAFSANQEFKNTGPSFNPISGTTDPDGNVQTTLTSGDGAVPGLVKATCEEMEATCPVAFETGQMVFDFVDPQTEEPVWDMVADGESEVKVRLFLTYKGEPVAGHRIIWDFSYWESGNPHVWDEEYADYQSGSGEDPYGCIDRTEQTTNANGVSYTIYTAPYVPGWILFHVQDEDVYLQVP